MSHVSYTLKYLWKKHFFEVLIVNVLHLNSLKNICLVLLTEFIVLSYIILNLIFGFVILPSLTLLSFWVFPFRFVDLNKLGGIAVLIHELNHIDPNARKVAAWILGKASQNNPIVQKQVPSYTECNYFH